MALDVPAISGGCLHARRFASVVLLCTQQPHVSRRLTLGCLRACGSMASAAGCVLLLCACASIAMQVISSGAIWPCRRREKERACVCVCGIHVWQQRHLYGWVALVPCVEESGRISRSLSVQPLLFHTVSLAPRWGLLFVCFAFNA